MPPKSFQQMLEELTKSMFASTAIEDLKSGSVVGSFVGMAESIFDTPHRRLARFLTKLDPPRFREASLSCEHNKRAFQHPVVINGK